MAESDQAVSPISDDGSDFRPPSDIDDGDSDEYVDEGVIEVDDDGPDPDADVDDDGDIDMSSGSRRGRGRGRGGRGRGTPRPVRGSKGGRAARKSSGVAFTTGTPIKRAGSESFGPSTIAAASESDLMAFPAAYREYLLSSAQVMVRGPDGKKEYYPNTGGTRVPIFPLGPLVPFVTHLKTEPNAPGREGHASEIEVVMDTTTGDERISERRAASRSKAQKFALLEPWQVWEGEGWWPEMSRAGESAGPVEGWTWRGDVRLGLDDVGRDGADEVISPEAGREYHGEGNGVVLHLGPHNDLQRVELNHFHSAPIRNVIGASSGFVFNAGAPVWGLDWCPYPERLTAERGWNLHVAVSTVASDPPIGGRCPPDTPGAIQIWSVPSAGDQSPACEIVLCVDGGPATEVKWMPMGAWDELDGPNPKLGILAAVQLDGTVSFYSVPEPVSLREKVKSTGPIYLQGSALLKLGIPDATVMCIDWLGGTRLIAGLSNGNLAVWEIDLASGETPLPSSLTTVGLGPVRSIAAGRVPPTTSDGEYDYAGDSVYVMSATWEGTISFTDLRDPSGSFEVSRSRLPVMAVAWAPQTVTPVFVDVDYMVTGAQLRNDGPSTHVIAPHRGPVWSIAASDYHHMLASSSADGALIVSSFVSGFYRRKTGGLLFHRLYELDYDEVSHEYRMVDDFKPEASGIEDAIKHAGKKKAPDKDTQVWAPEKGDVAIVKTAAWSRNVALHKAVWHTGGGLGAAGWLASGGYSGIVRVEMVNGRMLG